ncbi:hypothetical protein tb265_08050 [Gemmatimonadetes bacterium T265]|nr:hypothetical protein tb265_08050 [Gemmatimonadetes bacterium T265]
MRLLRTTGFRATGTLLTAALAAFAASACTFLTGVHSVSRVTVTVAPTTIAVNQTATAFGTAYDGNRALTGNSRYNITFSSTNQSVATVSATSGLVIGVTYGTAYIVGQNSGKRDSAMITVRPVQAKQVVISSRTPIYRVGATNTIGAAIYDSTGAGIGNRAITWTARTPTVLSISAVGVITPLTVGTTWIVASVDNGPGASPVLDSVLATVTPTPVTNISITPTAPTIYTGQTLPFTATVTDSLLNTVTRRVIWTSAYPTVLAIDSLTGLATPVTAGYNTTVTATVDIVPGYSTLGKRSASVTVSVLAPTANVIVRDATGATITTITVNAGSSAALTLVARDALNNTLSGRTFNLTSSNPAVATTPATSSQSTQVTAVSSGTTTLTVQALDASGAPQGTPATVTVTVP